MSDELRSASLYSSMKSKTINLGTVTATFLSWAASSTSSPWVSTRNSCASLSSLLSVGILSSLVGDDSTVALFVA